jgi:hypothetical protein
MRLLARIRERFQRRYDFSKHYAPEPGSGVFRDPNALNTPVAGGRLPGDDTPTATMPATYKPHGIDTPEKLAEIRAQAEALASQASAATETWGEWDEPAGQAPLVPAGHEPPPMPPSFLSRIMVSQIPSPQPGDLSYDRAHNYADYLRRIGVATGTSTDLEHTGMWALPALEPGDGTGVRLAGQEHGQAGPEVAA